MVLLVILNSQGARIPGMETTASTDKQIKAGKLSGVRGGIILGDVLSGVIDGVLLEGVLSGFIGGAILGGVIDIVFDFVVCPPS